MPLRAPTRLGISRHAVASGAATLVAVSLLGCARRVPDTAARQTQPIAWAGPAQRSWNDAPATPFSTPAAHAPISQSPPPTTGTVEPAAPAAAAVFPFHAELGRDLPEASPARRIADLSPADCRKEAARRDLAVVRSKSPAKGVAVPLRISGPFQGVTYRLAPAPSPYGMVDCRLALALDEMASVVAPYGVEEVRIDNVYRPKAHLPGKAKLSQHAHALAVDIVSFTFADGRVIAVEDHWNAPIGSIPCGPDASMDPPTDDAVLLRTVVCDVAVRGVFHHMLTPSYDASHRDHLHFDIKRDSSRRSVR